MATLWPEKLLHLHLFDDALQNFELFSQIGRTWPPNERTAPSGGSPALPESWESGKPAGEARALIEMFWRARSRLYPNEILQENMRLSRFDSIFQDLQDVHTSAPLQSQNFRKKSV